MEKSKGFILTQFNLKSCKFAYNTETFKKLLLKPCYASESPGKLVTAAWGSMLVSYAGDLEWSLKIYISNTFPGDVDAGPGTTPWEKLIYRILRFILFVR